MESQWPIPTPRTSSKKAISLAESRANPTSCPARLLERIAPLHARSGGVKAGGVQTAAAESYRLYLPHWNRFRKPPPDRAAEKGSVAVHGHCEATLTRSPRRSSRARRPDCDHPVYARVRPYARSAKALQRRGFVTIGHDDITRLTDAGRAFLVRYRRGAVQGKRVAEGLTLHLDDISSLFGGRGAA